MERAAAVSARSVLFVSCCREVDSGSSRRAVAGAPDRRLVSLLRPGAVSLVWAGRPHPPPEGTIPPPRPPVVAAGTDHRRVDCHPLVAAWCYVYYSHGRAVERVSGGASGAVGRVRSVCTVVYATTSQDNTSELRTLYLSSNWRLYFNKSPRCAEVFYSF